MVLLKNHHVYLLVQKSIILLLLWGGIFFLSTQEELKSDHNWPMFKHDSHHTGFTPDFGPPDDSVLWTYDFGTPLYSSPIIQDGIVYQGGREYMAAFDLDTGECLWKTDQEVVGSTPAIQDTILVAATNKGVIAITADTGEILWSHDLVDVSNQRVFIWEYYLSSPVIENDRIFIGAGTNLPLRFPEPENYDEFTKILCLDLYSGNLIWERPCMGHVSSSPCVQGDRVYFTSDLVEAADINTGEEIWSEFSGSYDSFEFIIVNDLSVLSNSGGILGFDIFSGNIVWKLPDAYIGLPATDERTLVGNSEESITCVDIQSKSILWETQVSPGKNGPIDFPRNSSPSIAQKLVYVGGRHGYIYCVGLDNGSIWWEFETGDSVVASPAISDGKMVIGSTDGILYCFGTNPEDYFTKAREYEAQGNDKMAQEFYMRAKNYYEGQGNEKMINECQDQLGKSNSLWTYFLILIGFSFIMLILLKKWKKFS
jgi:outer membrane protein assembly factor BamB